MAAADPTVTALPAEDLLEAHPVATLLISPTQTIVLVNQAAEQLANMGRASMVGRPLFDIVRLDSQHVARIGQMGERAYIAHAVMVGAGHGADGLTDLQYVPLGRDGHHLLTLVPITGAGELLALGQSSASRSAGAAASILAHEIKNPLAGIRGAAQLIARQTGDESRRFTDLICNEVDRVAALIDRMQHFSRGGPIPCTPTNIYPAIAQVSDSIKAAHGDAIRLTEEFDPSIPLASANHDTIVQILMNLLTNAAEALAGQQARGGDPPVIRLTTSYRHGLLLGQPGQGGGADRIAVPIEICVADNGPGISPELGDAIFEPFVTSKRDGQGLGLALVAKLARDMGGAVQMRRVDQWTQFRLHLPAAARETGQ
jgi:two-component system nitrogen regulation sensor histidine kinase GlnL